MVVKHVARRRINKWIYKTIQKKNWTMESWPYILRCILMEYKCKGWINLAQDRRQWCYIVQQQWNFWSYDGRELLFCCEVSDFSTRTIQQSHCSTTSISRIIQKLESLGCKTRDYFTEEAQICRFHNTFWQAFKTYQLFVYFILSEVCRDVEVNTSI